MALLITLILVFIALLFIQKWVEIITETIRNKEWKVLLITVGLYSFALYSIFNLTL